MELSDHELLDLYRKGQVDALEALIERYKRPLFGYILNISAGRDDADDIFQEAWLRVIKKLDLYKRDNFFGWLVRITRNLIIDRARRRKPSVSLDEPHEDGRTALDLLAGSDPDPLSNLTAGALGQAIRDAVASLPEEQKEVFLMRTTAGLPFKDIAKVQKTSINTALARMQYALTKLRPLLQEEYDGLARGGGM